MQTESKNFLLEQFKESMVHARHLETLRARHMAFFFTVFLASVGVAVSSLGDHDLLSISAMTRFMIGLWGWFLDAIALLMLISVKKLGFAHARHLRIIGRTRERLLEGDVLDDMFGPLGEANPVFRSRVFSVQFMNEAAVCMIMIALDLGLSVGVYYGFSCDYLEMWQNVTLLCLLVATVVLQVMVYMQPWVDGQQSVVHDTSKIVSAESD